MAEPDYGTMTDEQLLAAAHAAGVDAPTPEAPKGAAVAPADSSGMSTLGKVGLGALATGAGALALKYPELRTMAENLAARAGNKAAEVPLFEQAGLRTAENNPVARTLAGSSGQEALRLHTAGVSRTIAANEAGIPATQAPILSHDILADARRAPGDVYDRVGKALPTSGLDADAQAAIQQAGSPAAGRMSKGSPQAQAQIDDLKAQLLDPNRTFTGQQFINEVRGLRQEGFTNVSSDDVSNQQLGRAQLAMSRAIEDHIGRNIPSNADVTLQQFQDARKTLAKNFTVQNALRGGDVDLKALARAQRADPGVLDGGMKLLADFGDAHPEVAALPSEATRYSPPSATRDLADISLKDPASWVRPALGNLARRVLVGDPEEAIAQANQAFPARDPGSFSPPPPAPRPKFGGYLPAPAAVNAGGGASTANTLRDLGLTPDVQAAGPQHPGAARLQALREQLAQFPERPAENVDFQGPQKWGDFSIAPQGGAAPPAPAQGVPFENVLEQGGTQRAPVGAPGVAYRPPSISPNQNRMRTPPGAPELTEYTPYVPSDAQTNFRNQQAAARLRKVAGDLSVEGPGGNSGDPIARLRAALERRDRGYADGGEVRSSSPASPGVGGALKDAIAALKDYVIQLPRRNLQASREAAESSVVDDTAAHAPVTNSPGDYADGGSVSIAQRAQSMEDTARQLADLVSLHESQNSPPQPGQDPQGLAGGGRVELIERIGQYLDDLAAQRAARAAAIGDRAPKLPLVQSPDDPVVAAATAPQGPSLPPSTPQNPLQPGFLTKPQAHADGGSVDDSQSSVRKLADLARRLDNPSGTDPNAEHRARVATNLASLAYGLDDKGNPAFGGRAWTSTQGGTPAGVLDALTATPHNLVQLGKTIDKYLPGQSNPKFWDSIDPQWSQDASNRLGQLRQRMQQSTGVAPAKGLDESIADMVTDPSMVAPMGAAKLAPKGSALSRLINWSTGSSPEVAPAEGHAEGGEVISLAERLAQLAKRAAPAADAASTPATVSSFADAADKKKLQDFAAKLQGSVQQNAAGQQNALQSLGHQYNPGDIVAGQKGNYKVVGLAGTRALPGDIDRLKAGENLKLLNRERATRPLGPAYLVQGADGSQFVMPEWGIQHSFAGPTSVPDAPTSTAPTTGGE